jgi:hypothetical protein
MANKVKVTASREESIKLGHVKTGTVFVWGSDVYLKGDDECRSFDISDGQIYKLSKNIFVHPVKQVDVTY